MLPCFNSKILHGNRGLWRGVLLAFALCLSISVSAQTVEEVLEKAEQNDVEAQVLLGAMYYLGQGVAQNFAEAVSWYRKAAGQGDANAQFTLGQMYRQGLGIAQNDTEAANWYRKAAEQEHAVAQYNLGMMYINGHGVAQSDAEAVDWLRKAAEQGYMYAQYNLGGLYYEGRGVAQDYATAYMLLMLAISQTDASSSDYARLTTAYDELVGRLTRSQIIEAERLAQEWKQRHPR
ncbi:MAG: sel1 repeat family protein [Zoogloeaceae bacterium]|jgi:hypothetical protein|nr:sel1 repeat family protein [Zoogloeaceae bacterium]